jgi:hypothetical protein
VEARPSVDAVAPVAAEPAVTATLEVPSGLPVLAAVQAEPTLRAGASNNLEERLQRLEKMVESLVAESKNQRIATTRANSYQAARDYGITFNSAKGPTLSAVATAMKDTLSLSDLRKRRIDIEEQLDKLQDQLTEIDDQISKLQSARPTKRYRDFDKK